MKRLTIFTIAFFLISSTAEARKRRSKRSKPVNEQAIAKLMGDFKFGMTTKDVYRVVKKQIHEKYEEKIAEKRDVYSQDQLRKKRDADVKRFKESLLSFDGNKTGWDVSLIDDQFQHNTGESMMFKWEKAKGKSQRRFFFFFRGKLYKMFVTMQGEDIGTQDFSRLVKMFSQRYGTATKSDGAEAAWKGRSIQLQAINKLRFYDTFSLAITSRAIAADLAAVRKANAPAKKGPDAILDATTNKKKLKLDLNDDHLKGL